MAKNSLTKTVTQYMLSHPDVTPSDVAARFKTSKQINVALYQLALLYGETSPPQHKMVVQRCDELLRRKPTPDFALQAKFIKAGALFALAQYKEAADLYQEVAGTEGAPDAFRVASTLKLGHISFVQKDYGAASQYFADVGFVYKDKAFAPEALYYAGKSYLLDGDPRAACTTWARLFERFPDAAYADPAKKEIRKLGHEEVRKLGFVVKPDGSIKER